MKCKLCGNSLLINQKDIISKTIPNIPKDMHFFIIDPSSIKKSISFYLSYIVDTASYSDDFSIFKEFNYQVTVKLECQCVHCNQIEISSISINLTEKLHDFINHKIEDYLNSLSTITLGYGLFSEIFGDWTSVDEKTVINLIPDDLSLRKELNKLNNINEMLPLFAKGRERFGGHGGFDFEPIEWLLHIIAEELINYLIGYIVIHGIEAGGKKIKEFFHGAKMKQIIKKKIKSNDRTWEEVSLDDFEQYLKFPRKFEGSKEDLIEQVIHIKMEEIQARIIEKIKIKKK
jgi:hypothetical protein